MRERLNNKLFVGDIIFGEDRLCIVVSISSDTTCIKYQCEELGGDIWLYAEISKRHIATRYVLVPWAIFNPANRQAYIKEARECKILA